MTEINISKSKEPERVLRNMVMGIDGVMQVEPGTRVVYHEGQIWTLAENRKKLGAVVRELVNRGLMIHGGQRKTENGYQWIGIVV